MKKEKQLFYLMIIIFSFGFIKITSALENEEGYEDTCSNQELTQLRKQASNVKVTYVPVRKEKKLEQPDPINGMTETYEDYLEIKIYNMTSRMKAEVIVSGVESATYNVGFDDIGPDNTITLKQNPSNMNIDYEFRITGSETCIEKNLRVLRLTVPKYNFYSELEVCEDIPDYYLCAPYTTYNIDGSTFYERVEEYKEKINNQEIVEVGEENTGAVNQTFSVISKYKYIIVGVIVAIGVVITVITVKRKKSAK